MKILLSLILTIFWSFLRSPAFANFTVDPVQFAPKNVNFSWRDVKSKSLKIALEYREGNNTRRRVSVGSGFLISPDGFFVTAYHVMKHCLQNDRGSSGLYVRIDCSATSKNLRYVAVNGDKEFDVDVVSHLKESDSTRGKDTHTPDEIIKQRDFVIGKVKADASRVFSYWPLPDFDETAFSRNDPRADFRLAPLRPPKRVFVVGFPNDHDFAISEGFLNLTEENRRGFFAADFEVYSSNYLRSQSVPIDTRWGMRVENHMSGGAVIDDSGHVIGVVVNGNQNTAAILSIENVLATFFTKVGKSSAELPVLLIPTATPLFLKKSSPDSAERMP